MKIKMNNYIVDSVKENLTSAIGNKNELLELKKYFNECEFIIKDIILFEDLVTDEKVNNYDFFAKFFNYFQVFLDEEDLDLYLKELFEGNYQIYNLKTMIPNTKYDCHEDKIVTTVKKASFAVKDTCDIDLEHEYTSDEIVLLHNQNKARLLSINDSYRNIDGFEYSYLSKKYKNRKIMSLNFECIDKYNYFELLNVCPYLFVFIRNNITFEMISDLLMEYETKLTEVINGELDNCNKQIEDSKKRIDSIKNLTLKF